VRPRKSGGRRPPGNRSRGGRAAPGRHGLARWISKFGIMSRTEAARAVEEGRVSLNGRVARDPEAGCRPGLDQVLLDGRPLRRARRVYLALHKPSGPITTSRDPEGRATVYGLLPKGVGAVQAVGRLDADTSGLLLFTNDSEFAARITDSGSGVEKAYRARLGGALREEDASRFRDGLDLDGRRTLPARVEVLERREAETFVEVVLTEGRNRQVRRMWELLGYPVLDLHRTRIGVVELGTLPPGRARPLSEFERAALLSLSAPGRKR
jgi:23S rRNA pseudouridine2605 synthase